jgi:hypothetical protein
VLATVKTNDGNPVPNARVMFKLAGPTVKEGRFTTGSVSGTSVSYTGADGKVEIAYIPGSTPTSTQALSIVACFGDTVATAQACSNPVSREITVTRDPVSVYLGTDGLVGDDGAQSYVRNYVVQVVDQSGKAMSNVRVAADLNTVDFRKGSYGRPGSKWTTEFSDNAGDPVTSHYLVCPKEDLDDDDQLDAAAEDFNHSGRLEPRRAAVALSFTDANGNVTSNQFTNASGQVYLRLVYPKSVATWVKIELTATAIVSNSEGRDSTREVLRALVDDLNAEGAPAFVYSPFGVVVTSQAWGAATFPDGTAAPSGTIAPCNNPDFLR